MDWADPAGTPANGMEQIRVEWAVLDGARQKGKYVKTYEVSTKNKLATDVIDSLVTYLNASFPTEHFNDRDIVLWGA
jgi:hypothetical protein